MNNTDLLKMLAEELESSARALGINDPAARDLVAAYLDRVRMRAGGSEYWIRKRGDKLAQCAEIASAFDGKNHREVCERFNISARTLRRRLSQWRAYKKGAMREITAGGQAPRGKKDADAA